MGVDCILLPISLGALNPFRQCGRATRGFVNCILTLDAVLFHHGSVMDAEVLYSCQGSLPTAEVKFRSNSEKQLIFVSGSVFAREPGVVKVYIEIDHADVAEILIYANEPHIHIPAIPQMFPLRLGVGQHTLRLKAAPGTPTASDDNDFYQVLLIELT